MFQWIRKWHIVVAVVFGLYLILPKSGDPWLLFAHEKKVFEKDTVLTTVGDEKIRLLKELKLPQSGNLTVDGKDYVEIDADPDDADPRDPVEIDVTTDEAAQLVKTKTGGLPLRWPLWRYEMNLGQDLAGGTSLRYQISSLALINAKTKLGHTYQGWLSRGVASLAADVRGPLETFQANATKFPELALANVETLRATGYLSAEEADATRELVVAYDAARTTESAEDLVGPTIEKLNRRLNASGMTELNILPAGKAEIEVKIPALSNVARDRLKDILQSTGALELLLLPADKVVEKKKAKEMYPGVPEENSHWYDWYDVLPSQTAAALHATDGGLIKDPSNPGVLIERNPNRDTADAVFSDKFAVVTKRMVTTKFVTKNGEELRARIHVEAVLVQVVHEKAPDAYPISGEYLKNAAPSTSSEGRPAVSFELKGRGVSSLATISEAHTEDSDDPRLLAVAIDKKLYSAASIKSALSDNVQVTGNFTRAEVTQYVDTLKSGSLPVSLELTGEESVGPAEGADNISRGMWSIALGALLVFLFALVFYRRVGVLVVANLTLTIVLIAAVMSLFLSTLTLPGIAGLVLTLGMAIDANILINERIKEERLAGASGRAAIEAGFKKAFSAIVDGNITTLITALILSKIGSGPVAGFALTLSIGILATLYTSLLVYRTSFLWCHEKGLISEIRGVNLFKDTNYNILGFGKKVAIVNVVLMAAAFTFFLSRGSENFGIDFRGGTQVVVQFSAPHTREWISEQLDTLKDEAGNPKYKNAQVQARFLISENILGAGSGAEGHTRFEIRVPQRDEDKGKSSDYLSGQVIDDLERVFGGALAPEGFKPAISSAKKVDFIATVELNRPASILEDEKNQPWLEMLAGKGFSKNWFGALAGQEQAPVAVTSSDGKRQTVTFKVLGVATTDDDDAAAKRRSFYDAVVLNLTGKLTLPEGTLELENGALPALEAMTRLEVRQGALDVTLKLIAEAPAQDVERELRAIAGRIEDPLFRAGALTVTATTPTDNTADISGTAVSMAREFKLTTASGDITYDDSGIAQSIIAAQALQTGIESWLEQRGDGNHIAKPFPRATAIGGRVAGETQARALIALLIALIAIVVYIAVRFKSAAWGYAAVAALVHDTLFTLGAIAVCDALHILPDLKIDLNAVAALLTVIGYSLNDTIIIFDRVREELLTDMDGKRKRSLPEVINAAVNRTLARTVLTSGSTFVVVVAMLALGGPAIETFSLTLFWGLLFGTYSSIFRAGPFLLLFTGRAGDIRTELEEERKAMREAERAEAEALAAISVEREALPVRADDQGENAGKG